MSTTARDLIQTWARRLVFEQQNIGDRDQPITPLTGRLLHSIGTLFLYEFTLPAGLAIDIDTPLSIIPGEDLEPTEGLVLSCREPVILVQTFDPLGQTVVGATLIPDRAGVLTTWGQR